MPSLIKRNSSKLKQEPSLANAMSDNFSENSKVVKNLVLSTKAAIGPLSHVLDYALVSLVSILAYKYFF